MTNPKLRRLSALYREAEQIRRELRFSAPGSTIYLSSLDVTNAKHVMVEADGLGRAVVRVIEGNYPIDFFIHEEKQFHSEDDAVQFAERLLEERLTNAHALTVNETFN